MLKMEFNEKFLALRDVKRTLCEELKVKLNKVAALNKKLRIQEDLVVPEMLPGEEPELRDQVTDEEIEAYIAQQDATSKRTTDKGNASDGFGASGDQETGKVTGFQSVDHGSKLNPSAKPAPEPLEDVLAKLAASYPPTPIEQAQRTLNERRWVSTPLQFADKVVQSSHRALHTWCSCRMWKEIYC
jgi:hypothetical protein